MHWVFASRTFPVCDRHGRAEVGKWEDGKAITCWSLQRGHDQYLLVGQGPIERCTLVCTFRLTCDRLTVPMHRFSLTLSLSLSIVQLSCDKVALCFCFHILAWLRRDCSGSIRVHSLSACIHNCQRNHVHIISVYTYTCELTALNDYQPCANVLGN